MKCDNCPSTLNYKLYSIGKGVFVCESCYRRPPSRLDNVNLHKKVKLDSMWVTEAQIKEQDRMRILPYNGPNGTHYVGRMGENGRLQEREPNFKS